MSSDRHSVLNSVSKWLARHGITPSTVVVLIPVASIGASELLFFADRPSVLLWGHVATVLYAVIVSIQFDIRTEVITALALISVFRCVSLTMPVFFEFTLYWLPLVYASFLPVIYLLRNSSRVARVSIDVRTGIILLPLALPTGYILAVLEYRLIPPSTLLPSQTVFDVGLLVITILTAAFVEEYLFRGLLQTSLTDRFNEVSAVLLTSFIFGVTRSPYTVGLEIVLSFSIGMLLGMLYSRTESLAFVTLLHGSINLFLFELLPLGQIGF